MRGAYGRRQGKRARVGGQQAVKRLLAPPSLAVCALLLLTGCGASQGLRGAVPDRLGERSEARPQSVGAEADCASRPKPFAHLGTAVLIPDTVKPGDSVTHRIVYTLCTGNDALVTGRLRTRIVRGSANVLSDAVRNYRLKPGRWTVDSTVHVPPNAPEGSYGVVVDFAGNMLDLDSVGPITFARAASLNVRR